MSYISELLFHAPWELHSFLVSVVYTRMESWNPVQFTRNHPVAKIARRGNQASRTFLYMGRHKGE